VRAEAKAASVYRARLKLLYADGKPPRSGLAIRTTSGTRSRGGFLLFLVKTGDRAERERWTFPIFLLKASAKIPIVRS